MHQKTAIASFNSFTFDWFCCSFFVLTRTSAAVNYRWESAAVNCRWTLRKNFKTSIGSATAKKNKKSYFVLFVYFII